MGKKSKPPKFPGPKINSQNNPVRKYAPRRFFSLSQANLKKYMPNFSYPKRIPASKFSNPTSPSMIAVTKNWEYLHWGFVPAQISLSNVWLMTHFITAKQIVQNKTESERPTSKKETTTNGKRTNYLLIFGKRNTPNWKTKHPQLRWKDLQSTTMRQLIWSVTIPFEHLCCL